MYRHTASVTIDVPRDICYATVRALPEDARWRDAYAALRPNHSYSGRFVTDDQGLRLIVDESAIDPVTHARSSAFGWTIQFDFASLEGGRTRVDVAVEYGMLAAVGGMGTMETQAETLILAHLRAMLALEAGYRAAAR